MGIYVDENLNWQNHIDLFTDKIYKNIGRSFKDSLYLNKKWLTQIYFRLIHSYINYGNNAWTSTTPAKKNI